MAGDLKFCAGCREDYYNHRPEPGFDGATECWSLKSAEVVTRYRIAWWTTPDTPGAFTKVTTHHCHHEPGQFGFYKELPSFAVDPK